MTTGFSLFDCVFQYVVEAYRLGRYDNWQTHKGLCPLLVVEAYRLGRYDNLFCDES